MKESHAGSWIAGISLIALGIIFLLKSLGVIQISMWEGFKTFWPVGLMLVGIALIMRMKWLGFTLFVITIIAAGVYIADQVPANDMRETSERIQLEQGIKNAALDISYGAGELDIGSGSTNFLLENVIRTGETQDPKMEYTRKGPDARVSLERIAEMGFWNARKESWNISLSPGIAYSINIDYGAADAHIDLRNLTVGSLEISSGATDTEIIFDKYPTKASIESGASSVKFRFPKDYGVIVKIDGGLFSKNFEGLKKSGDNYISDSYDPAKENIEVDISAGAADFSGEFY